MNLKKHYNDLYTSTIQVVKKENFTVDHLIDSPKDQRHGITLLIRPPIAIKNQIQSFLADLKKVEPYQYYYDSSDIHITILSIISCYEGFQLAQIKPVEYIRLVTKSLETVSPFSIRFKGITAAPSSVMIQGFYNDSNLNTLRENLRTHFKNSSLEQSIDKRYKIITAHSTVVRFKEVLKNKMEFIKILNYYRNFEFGIFEVEEVELVFNDWYQKREKVISLQKFKL